MREDSKASLCAARAIGRTPAQIAIYTHRHLARFRSSVNKRNALGSSLERGKIHFTPL
jgi:hypothetical protein